MQNLADTEHAMVMFIKKFSQYQNENMAPAKFTDGWAFATILKSAEQFKLSYTDLDQSNQKWTFKLSNLKKIIVKIQEYFEDVIHKGIKTKDIDLIEIAKNNNNQQIVKFFQLIVATLTQAPNKQDHISSIMGLDERSQAAFMEIIQNVLEHRIQEKMQNKEDNIIEVVNQLETENGLLRQEVEEVLQQNHFAQKQLAEMKLKIADYEDELEKIKGEQIEKSIGYGTNQTQQLKNMNQNLKQKLLQTVREHEAEISRFKDEINILEHKLSKHEELEEAVEIYKQKYNESLQSLGKAKAWQRQKNRLNRMIDEKQITIKKMQDKMDQVSDSNFNMQQKQLYMKMQLQKRDVRYKELQKEVKKRLGNSTGNSSQQTTSFNLSNHNMASLSAEINEIDKEQMQELRNQIDQLKKKTRESDRENNRLKRNLDKLSTLEAEKKKLQRLILDLNNEKKEQVEMLLSTSHDFYIQNHRLKEVLQKNNIEIQLK